MMQEHEDDEFVDIDIFSDIPLATHKWNDRICSYYFEQVRDVAFILSTWSFNRNLNTKHKDEIKKMSIRDEISPSEWERYNVFEIVRSMFVL